jgi:hypothetical protein
MDWDKFNRVLNAKLSDLPVAANAHVLQLPSDLDEFIGAVTGAIQGTISQVIPLCVPSPYKKLWWTKELTKL